MLPVVLRGIYVVAFALSEEHRDAVGLSFKFDLLPR